MPFGTHSTETCFRSKTPSDTKIEVAAGNNEIDPGRREIDCRTAKSAQPQLGFKDRA
jgi:hypothetical protein